MENAFFEVNPGYIDETLISENIDNDYPLHFHQNVELHYVRSGTVVARVNDNEYTVEKDEIILVPSFFVHEFHTPTHSDTLVLVPHSNLVRDFLENANLELRPTVLSDKDFNKNILLLLTALLNCRHEITQKTLTDFFQLILGMLCSHYPATNKKHNSHYNISIDMLNYMHNNYTLPITLDDLAATIGYSKYYVSKLLKRYTGCNFYSYLNRIRIQNAISIYSDKPVLSFESLGHMCGFRNTATFFRAFKTVTGMTPKAYFTTYPPSVYFNRISYDKSRNPQ